MILFKVQNKYTNAIYDVLAFDNVKRKVILKRQDNTEFSIDISEYRCYYRELREDLQN